MTPRNYDRLAGKFLAVVGGNMPRIPDDVLQRWIKNPKALQNVLQNALYPPVQDEAVTTTHQQQFAAWKTIELGTYKRSGDLAAALKRAGFRIGIHAAQILRTFPIAPSITEIEIVNVSVGELGFERGATCAQIYTRATTFGLDLVPAEVGPQLRLQYPDQPYGGVLIGMEPVGNTHGYPNVFGVGNAYGGRWLGTGCGDPNCFWSVEIRWVFARRT